MVQDTSIIKTLLSAVYLFPESISNTIVLPLIKVIIVKM